MRLVLRIFTLLVGIFLFAYLAPQSFNQGHPFMGLAIFLFGVGLTVIPLVIILNSRKKFKDENNEQN